jgi:Tfp pilus assembly protein FimT
MVELTITMAILAVVAAVSIPRYDPFLSGRRLEEAVQREVNDLRVAQSSAIANSGLFRFRSGSDPNVDMPRKF